MSQIVNYAINKEDLLYRQSLDDYLQSSDWLEQEKMLKIQKLHKEIFKRNPQFSLESTYQSPSVDLNYTLGD
jgi:hypothetical protein